MLCLRRHVQEMVQIDSSIGPILVKVIEVDAFGRVLLGFQADRETFVIRRSEVPDGAHPQR